MPSLFDHITKRTSTNDWLIAAGILLLFVFLRYMTRSMGLPPLELVAVAGAGVLYLLTRSVFKPTILLVLITAGSLLGNLILVIEDGLIPFSLFQIFYIFALLVFILRWFMSGFGTIRKTGFELELALFFSLVFVSILYTPDAERAFLHAIRVLALAGLLFLFVNWIKKSRDIDWVIISMVITGSILGLIAIYDTINNPQAIFMNFVTGGTRVAARVRIGQVDPNIFGSLFFLPLAYTASLSFSGESWWKRSIAALFFLLLFAAVMVTFSRSSYVSVLVMLVFLAVMYRQYNLFLIGAGIGVALIIAVPELRFLFINILNRFVDLFTGDVDTSNYLRLVLLEGSLKIFFDSWLLGVGWRGFPDAFMSYYSFQETMGVYEPHNVIYLVYSELGLIGLLLFTFIVYKIFHIAWQNIQLSSTAHQRVLATSTFGAFLAYAVFYQFIGSGFLDNQLWITTGLILSLNYHLKEKADSFSEKAG